MTRRTDGSSTTIEGVAHVFRVRAGAIVRFEQFADTSRIKAAATGGANPA